MRRLLVTCMVLWAFGLSLHAQYEGKEFWVTCGIKRLIGSFIYNASVDSAYIYILGHHAGTGYIENPHSSTYIPFNIYPDSLVKIAVSEEELVFQPQYNPGELYNIKLQGSSLYIHTDVNVQAWVQSPSYSNHWVYIYPFKLTLFPKDYFLKEFNEEIWSVLSGDFYVLAIEDSTIIYRGNWMIHLNRGDICFIYHNPNDKYTIYTNCKPIAVFTGVEHAPSFSNPPDLNIVKGQDFMVKAFSNRFFCSRLIGNSTPVSRYPYPNGNYDTYLYHDNYDYPLFDSVIYAYDRYANPSLMYIHLCIGDTGYYNHSLHHPTEKMVTHWDYPITKNTFSSSAPWIDTSYVDLTIFVHADGLNSTFFDGNIIPASSFDTFPATNGEYYVAQLCWYDSDSLPDYITIENPHGFTAYISEIGYTRDPTFRLAYAMHNSSGYDFHDFPYAHSNLSMLDSDTVYRCVGDTLVLKVEYNPDNIPLEWIYEGTSYMVGMGQELSFLLPSVDTLTAQLVLHYNNCPDTTTTFIVVVPPPIFEVCHDDTLCHGAQLSVEQPNVLSYQWSDGTSGPALTVDSAGTYSVTVTNLGCKAESDLFTIDLYPQSSVEFGNDSILCELATLLLDATQPHPAQYVWQDQSTNTTYTVYEDGQYWVVVTDHCLGASDTIAIGYLTDFTVDLGPDTTICEGRTLVLSAGVPFCDYEWQDGSTQPTYLVRHSGTYSVTASNQCFEHGDDIVVEYEPCDQELWMPNSFTPNGDGLNDLFLPVFAYPDEVESFEMTIYDRGGMVQYMTRRLDKGWDAAGVPIGTYVVFIRYKSKGHETRDVTGSVTVVR